MDEAPAMLGFCSGLATLLKEKKSANFNDTLRHSSAIVNFKNITRRIS
jgi:hypothetical protein